MRKTIHTIIISISILASSGNISALPKSSNLISFKAGGIVRAEDMNHNFQLIENNSNKSNPYSVYVSNQKSKQVLDLSAAAEEAKTKYNENCSKLQMQCYVVIRLAPGPYQFNGTLPPYVIIQGDAGSVIKLTGSLFLSKGSQLQSVILTSDKNSPEYINITDTNTELQNVKLDKGIALKKSAYQTMLINVS